MNKSKFLSAALVAGAAFGALFAAPSPAQARVEAGLLTCNVEGGAGFIIGSTKDLVCKFEREGRDERYVGTINKFGLDIGITGKTVIVWTVLAATRDIPPGALNGSYGGVSAEATVGAGLGANALIGGFEESVVLQPISVQAQTGINLAVGIASLKLHLAR